MHKVSICILCTLTLSPSLLLNLLTLTSTRPSPTSSADLVISVNGSIIIVTVGFYFHFPSKWGWWIPSAALLAECLRLAVLWLQYMFTTSVPLLTARATSFSQHTTVEMERQHVMCPMEWLECAVHLQVSSPGTEDGQTSQTRTLQGGHAVL